MKKDLLFDSIVKSLKAGPGSITDIAAAADINWRTAESYLENLKKLNIVEEEKVKNKRLFFYRDMDNYFKLPIREKDEQKINTLYAEIREFCQSLYQKDPTKTQAYKIVWKVNKELNLQLPVGWYKYGPTVAKPYTHNHKATYNFNKETIKAVKETTEEYCKLDNVSLQLKIYKEEHKKLYLAKTAIESLEQQATKEELRTTIGRFRENTPEESYEVVTDFMRTTIMTGWNLKTEEAFNLLWDYISKITYRDTLDYYGKEKERYFKESITKAKREAQLYIKDLTQSYMVETYGEDPDEPRNKIKKKLKHISKEERDRNAKEFIKKREKGWDFFEEMNL